MTEFINTYILGMGVPILLIFSGIFYGIETNFFYIRHPMVMIRAMLKKPDKDGISPARAVTLALAGTLGVGNIVGVSSAIFLGGFGAIFWMWISALAAMVLKYAEIVLAVNHRRVGKDGSYHGGAMYYIIDCFSNVRVRRIGYAVAGIFAILCIIDSITMGCVIQINAVSRAFLGVFDIPVVLTGIILAPLTAVIISGGAKGISSVTEKLVPIMTVGYIVMSIAVMVIRRDALGDAVGQIFAGAFSPKSTVGGVVGFVMSRSLRYGTMRGLVSNEAGCGTAPIAHAASNTRNPAEQGFWGIFEVFVDTIVLCTMTAIVIIISYDSVKIYGNDSIMMTIRAYSAVLGDWAEYFMCIAVLLFGFATVICWAHYGSECVRYLTRRKMFKWIYVAVYSGFVVVGAVAAPDSVWTAADLAIGAMTIINISVILRMRPEVKRITSNYFS